MVNICYYKFPKNFKFNGESHNFWEFVYVDFGELLVGAGARQYNLNQGEMAFHQPNEFHNLEANGSNPCNAVVVSFGCTSKAMDFFKNKILFLNNKEKECLAYVVEEAQHTFTPLEKSPPIVNMIKREDAKFGADQIIKTNLELLLLSVHRRSDSIEINNRIISPNQEHNYDFIVSQAIDIMESNFDEKITIDYISSRLYISSSHLKKVFTKQTGQPIMSYLTKIRIDEAKRLIQESKLNFTEISEKVGYNNIHYFSKVFKEKTGVTLTEYSLSLKC